MKVDYFFGLLFTTLGCYSGHLVYLACTKPYTIMTLPFIIITTLVSIGNFYATYHVVQYIRLKKKGVI